ncbi:hypothetical protein PROFUN_06272 [Planoprotostelium fungivorum]|uniref:Uncharacterized protein n=1 Tax=Planoprotostelium fungivorum TaxID=1890364 RepID=A0A2P6NE90_9EUKA|nr:hypothetical protein PROFUN_06272 [Planoprotostelium fungivorum]
MFQPVITASAIASDPEMMDSAYAATFSTDSSNSFGGGFLRYVSSVIAPHPLQLTVGMDVYTFHNVGGAPDKPGTMIQSVIALFGTIPNTDEVYILTNTSGCVGPTNTSAFVLYEGEYNQIGKVIMEVSSTDMEYTLIQLDPEFASLISPINSNNEEFIPVHIPGYTRSYSTLVKPTINTGSRYGSLISTCQSVEELNDAVIAKLKESDRGSLLCTKDNKQMLGVMKTVRNNTAIYTNIDKIITSSKLTPYEQSWTIQSPEHARRQRQSSLSSAPSFSSEQPVAVGASAESAVQAVQTATTGASTEEGTEDRDMEMIEVYLTWMDGRDPRHLPTLYSRITVCADREDLLRESEVQMQVVKGASVTGTGP